MPAGRDWTNLKVFGLPNRGTSGAWGGDRLVFRTFITE